MKRGWALLLALCLLLGGCGGTGEMDRAMALRQRLLNASGCSFEAEITADYGEKVYTFSMSCQADSQGTINFTVTAPESIAGVTGELSASGGKLTFDENLLAFDLLADGQVSPVSAPWLFLSTLRGGYLTSCGREGDGLRLAIDDSYEEDALHLDIWLDSQDVPVRCEILWRDRRILSLSLEKYTLL